MFGIRRSKSCEEPRKDIPECVKGTGKDPMWGDSGCLRNRNKSGVAGAQSCWKSGLNLRSRQGTRRVSQAGYVGRMDFILSTMGSH